MRKVCYYETFLLMLKVDILNEFDFYKCKEHILLLVCRNEGLLKDAADMIQLDGTFHFMMSKCVHDAQCHLERMSGLFRGHYQPGGERVVGRSRYFNYSF